MIRYKLILLCILIQLAGKSFCEIFVYYYDTKLVFSDLNVPQIKEFKKYNDIELGNSLKCIDSINLDLLLTEFKTTSLNLNLNDWFLYRLVESVSNSLYSNEEIAKVFSWIILNRLGYDVRIAYTSNSISLSAFTTDNLDRKFGFKINNKFYQIISDLNKQSKIKESQSFSSILLSNAGKPFSFELTELPNMPSNICNKTITFNFEDKLYESKLTIDSTRLKMLENYPSFYLMNLFTLKVSTQTLESLEKELINIVQSSDTIKSIELYLAFVRTGFAYRADDKNSLYDNWLFPEQTLASINSDCEDRVSLFYLLLKINYPEIPAILLRYNNHLSIALALDYYQINSSNTINYRHKKYFICDPTLQSGDIGEIPKEFYYGYQIIEI